MAEILAVAGAAAGVVSAAAAAWQANHTHRKDKIESSKDSKTIHENLVEVMEMLIAIRDDYEDTLKKYGARKKPTETYCNWSRRVKKLEGEVNKVSSEYKSKSQKPKWLTVGTGSKLNKEMKKKSLDANRLCEVGSQLGDILVEKEPDSVIRMDAPDIKKLPTLQKQLENILNLVTDEKNGVKCVRVWGMPGTGKTTIMQNLNNHEKVHEYFDFVIWLNVSTEKNENNLSMDQLRQEFVRRLKLNLEGVSDDEAVGMIKEKLKDKKYLLLLDDVKKDLKLDQIGIDPKNRNGSKIVLTTTVRGVCRSMVDRMIEVKTLSPEEAFEMFKDVLGQSNHKDDPRIDRVIVQIVQYCGGLPLLIKNVANSFKMRDTVDSWSEGYKRLLVWGNMGDNAIISLYKMLIFCFDQLKGAQKDCFFYSAIYPEDYDVHKDCLYDCWAAEDLYGSINVDNFELVRAHGSKILEDLKEVSLLEECVSREYVRMHKWIRRAALYKLSSDDEHKHLVKTGKSLQQPLKVEQWKQKKWISLVDNEMESLPESPDCPMLSTLFLQKNPFLKTIPDLFFEYMGNLRVLNVDGTGIMSLPSSMSKLIRLKVLYLNGCTELGVLPSQIGELKNVEVLDIRCSTVERMPPEIANLSFLRRLLVSLPNFSSQDDTQVVLYNCDVISSISNLEELIIDVKSYKHLCIEMQHVVIDKVAKALPLLTTLKFCFDGGVEDDVIKVVAGTPTFSVPNADAFMGFLHRRDVSKPKSFQVFIGCSSSSPPRIPNFHFYERYLRYRNGKGHNATICQVLTQTDALELFNHKELEHLSDFGIASLHKVRGCLIEDCNQIRAITNKVDSPILPNLEELYVKMMPQLESILKGPVVPGSFCKLRTLKIENCTLIKELLVDSGNATLYHDFLPNLEMLILIDMPNLTRICSYKSLDWPALMKLQLHGCLKLIELPFTKDNARKLTSIEAERTWWDKLQWQEPEVKERLQPYCSFR